MTDIQSVFHKVLAQEYEGETDPETGAFHGQGKLWMNNGHVYDGTFHQGWLHGKGILYWNDGTIYEGDFQENRATGSCRIEWLDFNLSSVLNHGAKLLVQAGSRMSLFRRCLQFSNEWKRYFDA